MSSELLLTLRGAGKTYPVRRTPARELATHLLGLPRQADHRAALEPLDLQVCRGESVGIVGLNGAGKSTLLQLASGVLSPSSGTVHIQGRVAALLELGSGFNPEATGRDNIYLYAATLGLTRATIEERLHGIIDFSGLRDFIDAPVKTYSSGMQVRLAFSVATSVDPDVLIVDEALSVGDGVFAKKSFDRIMALRERGTALLLSSHALFHVDLFCQRTLWLHQGRVRAWGDTKVVIPQYQEFLDQLSRVPDESAGQDGAQPPGHAAAADGASDPQLASTGASDDDPRSVLQPAPADLARLLSATVELDDQQAPEMSGQGGCSVLRVRMDIQASPEEPSPRAAVVISSDSGRIIGTSVSPPGLFTPAGPDGRGSLAFGLPELPLNHGRYRVGVYLLCSMARFVYVWSDPHVHIQVGHQGPHQGPWLIPGQWSASRFEARPDTPAPRPPGG
jgi:lipopolysaccharide transport system ATP-binding protein